MIRILSIGSTELVFLHLFIHAIFKSLIFYMCWKIYTLYIYGNQDIRLWNILYLSIKKNNYYYFNFKIMWISFFNRLLF